jgi:hypothetical protein
MNMTSFHSQQGIRQHELGSSSLTQKTGTRFVNIKLRSEASGVNLGTKGKRRYKSSIRVKEQRTIRQLKEAAMKV